MINSGYYGINKLGRNDTLFDWFLAYEQEKVIETTHSYFPIMELVPGDTLICSFLVYTPLASSREYYVLDRVFRGSELESAADTLKSTYLDFNSANKISDMMYIRVK